MKHIENIQKIIKDNKLKVSIVAKESNVEINRLRRALNGECKETGEVYDLTLNDLTKIVDYFNKLYGTTLLDILGYGSLLGLEKEKEILVKENKVLKAKIIQLIAEDTFKQIEKEIKATN